MKHIPHIVWVEVGRLVGDLRISIFRGRAKGALTYPAGLVNTGKFLVLQNSYKIMLVNFFDLMKHIWCDIDLYHIRSFGI